MVMIKQNVGRPSGWVMMLPLLAVDGFETGKGSTVKGI
jgi:hypothetical protein